jgi:DNA-binding NtrC family response regulator
MRTKEAGMSARVLLMEDDPHTARLLTGALETERFEVAAFASARLGLPYLAEHPVDCILLDYRLQDTDGLECLRDIRARHYGVPVIMITAWGSQQLAVEAMKLGVSDYIVKEGRYLPKVPLKVREALGSRRLATAADGENEAHVATARVSRELRDGFRAAGIIGASAALERTFVDANAAARSNANVLLVGETGTGKELFARAIHSLGRRAHGPFLAQNCATLPEPLLESELFGHDKGAFTGATRRRRGLFAEADGGTLFLDEISEASLPIQAKLLRVVEDRVIRPVGDDETQRVDVRLITAANCDLEKAVQAHRFNGDLFHRLHVLAIHIPPLRERAGDIELLAEHFLTCLSEREEKSVAGFDAATLQLLARFTWPGNVRELQNEIHRLVVKAANGKRITPDLLSPCFRETPPPTADDRPLKDILREVRIAVVQERLRRYGYRVAATAASLGVSRESLWKMREKLGLQRKPDDEE